MYWKNIKELKDAILYAKEKLRSAIHEQEKEFYTNNIRGYKKLIKKMEIKKWNILQSHVKSFHIL